MLLTTVLSKFEIQLQANGRSIHTIQQYDRHIRLLDRWMIDVGRDRQIARIGHEALAEFLASPTARSRPDGRPKRSSSMNVLRSSLRAFFAYAHEAGYTPRNPARLIRRARCGPPPPRSLSRDEQQRLIDALDRGMGREAERDRLLFGLMLATGIRLGEALDLQVGDIDLDGGGLHLRRTKGDRPRVVVIPGGWVDPIQKAIECSRSPHFFEGRSGQRLSARHARRRFDGWLAEAGIGRSFSPHSLRHTFATRLFEQTRDIVRVKHSLDHRSLASSLRYACATG